MDIASRISSKNKAENSKLRQKVEKLETAIAQQQGEMKVLTAALKEQASQVQKVNAQLELNKPAPQTVVSNR